jgi:hypothetical protein
MVVILSSIKSFVGSGVFDFVDEVEFNNKLKMVSTGIYVFSVDHYDVIHPIGQMTFGSLHALFMYIIERT